MKSDKSLAAAAMFLAGAAEAAFWEMTPAHNTYVLSSYLDENSVPLMQDLIMSSRLSKFGYDLSHDIYDPSEPSIPLVQFSISGGVPGSFAPLMTSAEYSAVVFDDGTLWFPGTFRFRGVIVDFSYYNEPEDEVVYFARFGELPLNPIDPQNLPDIQADFDFSNFYLTKDGGFGRAVFDGRSVTVTPLQNPGSVPNFDEYVAAHVPAAPTVLPIAALALLAGNRRRR